MKNIIYIFITLSLFACTNNMDEVNKLISDEEMKIETAHQVEILYSDSAIVKVRIISKLMKRYYNKGGAIDEFPEGIVVEFLGENKKVKSWLEADYAIRKDLEKKFYVKENVVLYNKRNDKLETDELIWNEELEEIFTNKPVKITQPTVGDTSFGFGFRADQEFTRFEIFRQFSGIKNIKKLTEELDKNEE